MILVDTSVLIDLFRGNKNKAVNDLREVIHREIPFGITSIIYQEILQGAKDQKEFTTLENYLGTQRFYHPQDAVSSYAGAADIYRKCRKKGVSIRSTIDCLIARIALEHDLFLLHNDKDFTHMAPIIGLQIYKSVI